jgi:thiopurine S-methyltransferase
MDAEFWLERWRSGRTNFHQAKIAPLLQKYWPDLALPAASQVLVPLAGKSLDMLWLAAQGYRVLGVELSSLAVAQFFSENQLQPEQYTSDYGVHSVAGNIEIICGDIFRLDAAILSQCHGVYDRAALIALPPAMRTDYVRHVYGQLADHYRGLLITLDYPQEQIDGPPFSVNDAEVQTLYATHSTAQILDRRDILDKEPRFSERGVTRLDTLVYRLHGQR